MEGYSNILKWDLVHGDDLSFCLGGFKMME